MSAPEDLLAFQLRASKISHRREYRFHETRRWRFDFAWPERKIACEVEGGAWNGGRHTRGAGFDADLLKYGEAIRAGWQVFRCSPSMVKSGYALAVITELLGENT